MIGIKGFLAAAALSVLLLASPALATDYYVNSGASCPGSGTSGSPYCSFSSVNALDLAPGDRILLARGATFNASTGPSLILGDEDDGSSVSWNSVEPYGSGADPIITGASAAGTTGIVGTNLDYWKFIEIEFKNASQGFLIGYTTLTHTGLRFDKLYLHDMVDSQPWTGKAVHIYTTTVNHALSATTSASSTFSGYCACRINDGIATDFNGWASGDSSMPEWVQLDWTSNKTIDRVVFTTTSGYETRDFQIQYWNGSSWVTPSGASITGNTQKSLTITFSAVSTQKLRAYITLGDAIGGYARVDELAAYDWTTVPAPSPSQWVLKDIQITDTEMGPIGLYVAIDGVFSTKIETFQDIVFLRNYVHDAKWDMALRYNKNVKWIDNRNERIASGQAPSGNTDLHLWGLHEATFVNSIFDYTSALGWYDQSISDMAYRLDYTRFRNNLIEDAAGPGLEWHVWRTVDDYGLDSTVNYYTNQEVSGNVFRNNGWDTAPETVNNYEGGLSFPSNNRCFTLPTGTVSNNLYWEPTGFYNPNGCFASSLTFTNNLSIGTSAEIYHAGQTFNDASCSTSPWSYQSSTDGSSWSAMSTLDTVNPKTDVRCKPSGSSTPWVNRFEQFPSAQSSYSVARTWTAPASGTISIRSRALKAELGGDGVTVRVTKNGSAIIAATALGASDQTGVVMNADSISVTANDLIRFEVSDGANTTNDRISWSPAVAYTSKTYLHSAGFSSTQGANQWNYKVAAIGAYSYTNMANWDGTNSWWEESTSQPPHTIVAASWQHPGSANDAVLTWTAPASGSVTITNSGGNVRLSGSGGDGTTASILKNTSSSTYWSANILDTTGVSMGTVGPITVAAGDQIHFRINKRTNENFDATLWNPNVVFTPDDGSVSYIASARFGLYQADGQWSYKKAAIGVYSYTNLPYADATNNWWEEATSQPPYVLVAANWQHPDTSSDSVRTWTAPGAGSVTITSNGGNVRLSQTPNDGTHVSILKNTSSTVYWEADILNQTGVSMGTVGPISVSSGDQIHFRVNKRSNNSSDATLWDPKVVFTPSGW